MKRILLIILPALLIAMPVWAKRRTSEKGTPEITFETVDHDFGNLPEGDGWVEHTFKYTNTGTAPLAIATVSTSCGCSKAEFSTKPLAPGKSGTVKIRFTPAGIKKGGFIRTATVRTNIKGEKGKITLKISGNIIPNE